MPEQQVTPVSSEQQIPNETVSFLSTVVKGGKETVDAALKGKTQPQNGATQTPQKQQATPPATNGQTQQPQTPQSQVPQTNGQQQPAETVTEGSEEQQTDNPLLQTFKPTSIPEFKSVPEVGEFLQKKYSIADFPTFLNSVDTWRAQAQEGSKAQKQLSTFEKALSQLPEDLAGAVELFWKSGGKGDYRKLLNEYNTPFDTSAKFSSHNPMELAAHFGIKVNVTDPTAPDYINIEDKTAVATKMFMERLQDKYTAYQQEVESKRTSNSVRREDLDRSFSEALDASAKDFTSRMPSVKKGQIDYIKNLIQTGDADSIVYDDSGNVKKDGFSKLWWAIHGEPYAIEALKNYGAKVDELTKKVQELEAEKQQLLTRGGDQIITRTSERTVNSANKKVSETENFLNSTRSKTKHPLAGI